MRFCVNRQGLGRIPKTYFSDQLVLLTTVPTPQRCPSGSEGEPHPFAYSDRPETLSDIPSLSPRRASDL